MDVPEPGGAVAVAPPAMSWRSRQQSVLQWPSRPWQGVAVAVAAVSWTFAAAAVILLLVDGAAPGYFAYWAMDVLVAFVYGGTCLLMLPRSRHPVVWILVAGAIGCAISGFLTPYLELASEDPGLWAPAWLWVMPAWIWIPGTYAAIAVLPWLVSPWRTPRWVHPVVALGLAAAGWRVLVEVTADYDGIDNPLAVVPDWFDDLRLALGLWPDRLCVLLSLAGVARLLWLRARAGDRGRGYGWLACGQLFLAVAYLPLVFATPPRLDNVAADFAGVSLIAAQAFLPGALLVVVLGQQLWGIDVTVDRAIVWLSVSVGLGTCYVLVGWFVQQQLEASADIAALTSLAILLVASQPLRNWIQQRADHLVYGDVNDPAALLDSLGKVAMTARGGGLDAVAEALADGLRLGCVEIQDVAGTVVGSSGDSAPAARATAHELSLVVDDRRLGSLVVAPTRGQTLDGRSLLLIDRISGLVAVSLELVTVNGELQQASSRLVEVRQEERRMLRRDLHDGLGPALAGIGLGIVAAGRRLGDDPDGARELLGELHEEVARRTQDVRLLSRSLLPAALDDGDLRAALATLGARFESAGLQAVVDCGGLDELDTRRQVAIYHVASEALLNAHRHGHARRVTIRVSGGGPAEVVLEVVDDGAGLSPTDRRGVGLQSMQERASEQDGTLELGPGDGGTGTRLRMVLP